MQVEPKLVGQKEWCIMRSYSAIHESIYYYNISKLTKFTFLTNFDVAALRCYANVPFVYKFSPLFLNIFTSF